MGHSVLCGRCWRWGFAWVSYRFAWRFVNSTLGHIHVKDHSLLLLHRERWYISGLRSVFTFAEHVTLYTLRFADEVQVLMSRVADAGEKRTRAVSDGGVRVDHALFLRNIWRCIGKEEGIRVNGAACRNVFRFAPLHFFVGRRIGEL